MGKREKNLSIFVTSKYSNKKYSLGGKNPSKIELSVDFIYACRPQDPIKQVIKHQYVLIMISARQWCVSC